MLSSQIKAKDEKLFAAVQKLMDGNFDSYEDVYELSKKYIYKIINDIVQNHHTTEDMMQETYLQIYNKIGTLREARTFYVWAGRIASNLTLRHLQKYRKEFIQSASGEDDEDFMFDKLENDHEAFIPETVLENEEQQRIIAGILEGLSPEQKLTVQYYYFEEMSVGDIANVMECSTGTVKSRLNYARKSLKIAVNEFETTNDVKLYSISGLPIFYFVFKGMSEGAIGVTAGGAVVAGGVVAEGAAASGSGAGLVGSGTAAGSAAVTTTTVTLATGTTTGFVGTMAGKFAIVAATLVVSTGTATVQADVSRNELIDSGRYGQVVAEAEAAVNSGAWLPELDEPEVEEEAYEAIVSLYDGDDEQTQEEVISHAKNLDSEYLAAVNNLADAMVYYEGGFEYSLTAEQNTYIDTIMAAYKEELNSYLLAGEDYTTLLEVDSTGTFAEVYYPQIIDCINREADIVRSLGAVYYKEEVKIIMSKYTAADIQTVLEMGGGIGDLIAPELSEATLNELVNASQELIDLMNDIAVLSETMMSDPDILKYFE